MSNVNIFEQGREVKSGWANFEKVGDEVQGTYVGKKTGVDSYKNAQTIYELMDDLGNTILVGIRDTKTPFHDQMKHIRFGQIIGIKYTEGMPNDKGNDAKILKIWADPKIVNEEWLASQGGMAAPSDSGAAGENAVEEQQESQQAGTVEPKASGFNIFGDVPLVTEEDKIKKIIEIAGQKYGLSDANEITNKVMEVTNLAFIASNLDAIIEKISE